MKYAVLAGDRQFEIKETETFPVKANPLIRVTHTSVCGTDFSYWKEGGKHVGLVIGHEYSGIIEDPGTSGLFQKGDRVAGYTQNVYNEACGHCEACMNDDPEHCDNRKVHHWKGGDMTHPGSYSQLTTWFAHSTYKLPDHVDNEAASLIEPFSVALHAVKVGEIKAGDKVLILGGGIIGLAVSEWCRIYGAAEITLTEINPVKIEKIKGFGVVDHVLKADAPDLQEQLAAISGDGYDVCFDCVGFANVIQTGLDALKKDFYMRFVGLALPHRMVEMDYDALVLRQVRFLGSKGHVYEEFCAVARAVAEGRLDVAKYITKRIKFSELQKGFEEYAASGEEIKAVIVMDE